MKIIKGSHPSPLHYFFVYLLDFVHLYIFVLAVVKCVGLFLGFSSPSAFASLQFLQTKEVVVAVSTTENRYAILTVSTVNPLLATPAYLVHNVALPTMLLTSVPALTISTVTTMKQVGLLQSRFILLS